MTALELRDGWHRIERVLCDRTGERSYLPPAPVAEIDPLTLAAKLDALAREHDGDACEARQAAANCRQYASALRAGIE